MTADDIATAYWASHFGCQAKDLLSQPLSIVTHGKELRGYDGVFALFRGNTAIASLPPKREAPLRTLLLGMAGTPSPQSLVAALSPVTERVIGPAFIGYARAIDAPSSRTCELVPIDTAAIDALRQACSSEEWDHGGGSDDDVRFGIYIDGKIVAMAGYEIWGLNIAHVSVITHPTHRGHSYGRSVVARTAQRALADGLLPQYRTLESNRASMRIAISLGFQSYARSLAVRLTPSA